MAKDKYTIVKRISDYICYEMPDKVWEYSLSLMAAVLLCFTAYNLKAYYDCDKQLEQQREENRLIMLETIKNFGHTPPRPDRYDLFPSIRGKHIRCTINETEQQPERNPK